MDSTESFESSSRINLLEEQRTKTTNPQRPRFIVAIFFIFLLLLIIVATITVYVISNTHLALLVADPSDPVRTVCSVTKYKSLCYASITSFVNNTVEFDDYWGRPDPDAIAVYSVQANYKQLDNIDSLIETLISIATQSALTDCHEMLNQALVLNNPDMKMEKEEIEQVKSLLSTAKISVETCSGRLMESGWENSSDELLLKMYELGENLSNSISILSNIKIIRQQFYEPPSLSDFVLVIPQYIVLVFLFCLLFRLN